MRLKVFLGKFRGTFWSTIWATLIAVTAEYTQSINHFIFAQISRIDFCPPLKEYEKETIAKFVLSENIKKFSKTSNLLLKHKKGASCSALSSLVNI